MGMVPSEVLGQQVLLVLRGVGLSGGGMGWGGQQSDSYFKGKVNAYEGSKYYTERKKLGYNISV